jgi:uncharacterized protein (DUF1684 family)
MKYLVPLFLCLGLTIQAPAQTSYTDSIKLFQVQYINDLFAVIKQDTAHIRFYPVNPALLTKASVTLLQDQPVFKLVTSSGKSKEARKYALLRFTIKGKACQLYAYQLLGLMSKAETARHLFLPFIDRSSGKESYGGGRYIDLETDDIQNNEAIIDFNKAYNPYCAFTTGYNCPIPPGENSLPVVIKAGERYQPSHFKH